MKIACPECQATYEVALPAFGDRGIELRCAVCHHLFRIKRKAKKAPVQDKPVEAHPEPPAATPVTVSEATEPSVEQPEVPLALGGEPELDIPETLTADDEPLDIDLPQEVTADAGPLPDDNWEKVSQSAKELEDQELEEAAKYAEEFAKEKEEPPEETGEAGEPEEILEPVSEGSEELIDPEIWMGAMEEVPAPSAESPESEDVPSPEPFEDPEMWAEAFAEHATEDNLLEQAAQESETEEPAAGQPQEPEGAPPKLEAIPPSPEPREVSPAQPRQEPVPAAPEPPAQSRGAQETVSTDPPENQGKKWEDLETQLAQLEAQREQLKRKSSSSNKLQELEEQRLQLELERQKLRGEVYAEEDTPVSSEMESRSGPGTDREETAAPAEEPVAASNESGWDEEGMSPKDTVERMLQEDTGWDETAQDEEDEELDVIGLDEELAEQEKEVIGLDEEFAKSPPPVMIDGTRIPEPAAGPRAVESSEPAPAEPGLPVSAESSAGAPRGQEEEPAQEEPSTPRPAPDSERKLAYPQPKLTALEDLSGDLFNEGAPSTQEIQEGAMFDFVGDSSMHDSQEGAPAEPSAAPETMAGSPGGEADDFTASFFGESGEPVTESAGREDEDMGLPSRSSSNWVESLDDEDTEALTKEEMWEREFPGLTEEEESELTPSAAAPPVDDDPFSDISDLDIETDEMYDEEVEDGMDRPVVVGSEYEEDGIDEDGFEGVDDSAYEDFDDEDFEYALNKPRKFGPFTIPHGRKGDWVIGSVMVGLLLLLGTGYFLMKTFSPDELKDFMVAESEIPPELVPKEGQAKQPPLPTTEPEVKDLLKESEQEKKLDIDDLIGKSEVPLPAGEPETKPETGTQPPVPEPEPRPETVESIQEEAARLLEPSEDNELLKELKRSEVLQESQKEMEEAIQQEEKMARFIDPNASIVTFNTILPVAYNATDIRVLSFRLELEMNSPDTAEMVRKAMPVYEDMMMATVESFFQQRFYTDVVYAKERLRDKLTAAFNKTIENGKVKKADFTDFAIQ